MNFRFLCFFGHSTLKNLEHKESHNLFNLKYLIIIMMITSPSYLCRHRHLFGFIFHASSFTCLVKNLIFFRTDIFLSSHTLQLLKMKILIENLIKHSMFRAALKSFSYASRDIEINWEEEKVCLSTVKMSLNR